MDEDLLAVVIALIIVVGIIFGTLGYTEKLAYDCRIAMKDKPAVEIKMVCK